jgi:hypothetical protein
MTIVSVTFAHHKRKFRNSLRPVLAMLHSKKDKMENVEWELLVKKSIHDVKLNPTEYLGHDLPDNKLVADALSEIEDEFLKDVRTFR